VRDDGDVRSLFQTLGSAALGVGLGLGVLGLGFVVSRVTLADNVVVASIAPSPTVARTLSVTIAPTATATPTRTPSPTPQPTTTPDPMVVTGFQGQGLRLAALAIPKDYTVRSPIGGKVHIELYQYVDGEIRTGVTGQPTYPYIFVTAADREIKVRPGAVDRDVQLLVKDGDTVAAGTPLFKTLTTGTSSWQTFYDRGVTAHVVVSARDVANDELIDPVPLFKR
jgi:biotin carboxyl carrier protein